MNLTVCLSADTIEYPHGGGHLWAYLNWALGFRRLGCQLVWLESLNPVAPKSQLKANVAALKDHLRHYDLADRLALCSQSEQPLPADVIVDCLDLNAATEADLLFNLRYATHRNVVTRFRRSALLDIDPGLLQIWISTGQISVAPHDTYFTIGETVGHADALFSDCGLRWEYTPPCVALDWWRPCPSQREAPFTTVSHWWMDEWVGDAETGFRNDKRSGFLPFLDLPSRTTQPLELALSLHHDDTAELAMLTQKGWRIRNAYSVAATPSQYQRYIQNSRGEFSCAKPSYVRLQTAWISDRTICYLASGKPALVQHTGPSRRLPDAGGLFRFHTLEEAADYIRIIDQDYNRQSRLARNLAEDVFAAEKVVSRVLEIAL